jgi:hypothetical protein
MENTVYVATRAEDKAVIEHLLVADEQNFLLPERAKRLATETCGRMYVPVCAQFEPGQRVAAVAAEGQALNPELYSIERVFSVPESIVGRARAVSNGDYEAFIDFIRAFIDSP